MSFPRYPAYKPSGVEWLGEVPEHWEVLPLRRLIRKVTSGTSVNAIDEPASPGQAGVLKTSCVYTGEFRPEENKAILESELDRATCPVVAGSLVVSRMNTPDLVGAAGLVKNDDPFLFLPDRLWLVSFQDCDPQFMNYWCKSVSYRSQVQLACSGTSSSMQNLSQDNFYSFIAPLPPTNEQSAIATFLNHETAKIDALIAEQQRLIELLHEKRQAVISHAVTKGLNPHAPMKDSGVEWLGEVPEHWKILPCRAFLRERDERNYDYSSDYYLSLVAGRGVIPYEEKGDIGNKKPEDLGKCKQVRDGDFVINSMNYGIGSYGVSRFDGVCSPVYIVVTPNEELARPGFAFRVLENNWFQKYAQSFGNGILAHRCAIGWDILKSINAGIPPEKEQIDILSYLDEQTRRYEELVTGARKQIFLLQERRSALISAAVTGQIDVRGLVPEAEAA